MNPSPSDPTQTRSIEPSCGEALESAHLHVEGELDPLRTSRLLRHLELCASCREHVRELREERFWILESAIHGPALPPRFAERVTARLRSEERTLSLRRRLRLARRGPAAAAVLVLAFLGARWGMLSGPGGGPEEAISTAIDAATPAAPLLRPATAEHVAGDARALPAVHRSPGSAAAEPGGGVLASARGRTPPREIDCFDDPDLDDETLDPVFPSTVMVCATCADESVAVVAAATSRVRVLALAPAVFPAAPDLRDAMALAREIRGIEARREDPKGRAPRDPCVTHTRDPNADGRRDGSDVAFYLQRVLTTEGMHHDIALADPPPDPGCEEVCLGV